MSGMLDSIKRTGGSGVEARFETPMPMLDYMVQEICRNVQAQFALKGGYSLAKIMDEPRLTKDIDLSIASKESYEEFKPVLANIGEHFKSLGYIDNYVIKDSVQDRMTGGADYRMGEAKVVSIDIGFHDLLFGTRVVNLDVGETQMFTVERMISDKIHSTLSRKRFRRVKDIYDIFCITSAFDLDYESLNRLTTERMVGEEENWNNIQFNDEVIIQFKHTYDKLEVRSILTGDPLNKPLYDEVVDRFYTIADAIKFQRGYSTWDHVKKRWNV